MFSNTLSFLSSRNISDQVSHPYKTTGKIIVKKRHVMYENVTKKTFFFARNISCGTLQLDGM